MMNISFTLGILRDRTKSFRIFFKLCSQKCRTPPALTNRLRQTPPQNSNGNMLFEAFFDFRPHGTIYGPKSKNASKSMFPFEFCGGVWRNRLVRAGGVRQFWAHNEKKISKIFLRSLIEVGMIHYTPISITLC